MPADPKFQFAAALSNDGAQLFGLPLELLFGQLLLVFDDRVDLLHDRLNLAGLALVAGAENFGKQIF